MNYTNNEFQTDKSRRALLPMRRRIAPGWMRRINLDPMGASRLSSKGGGGKRRHLAITSFSAATFAVSWKHTDEQLTAGTGYKTGPVLVGIRPTHVQSVKISECVLNGLPSSPHSRPSFLRFR